MNNNCFYNEYWNVVFADDPTMSASQIEEILSVLDRYVVIVAVSGKVGTFGGITYADESVIRVQEGSFTVKMMDETYNWRLPLGSLLPKKVCRTCGESLNGAWKFCPWDGTKLTMPEEN